MPPSQFTHAGDGGAGGDDGALLDGDPQFNDEVGLRFDAPPNAVCGNGSIEQGEQCDDGNRVASDGCSAACKVEPGYACTRPGAACTRHDLVDITDFAAPDFIAGRGFVGYDFVSRHLLDHSLGLPCPLKHRWRCAVR